MELGDGLLVAAAGLLAGAVNTVAGGGTLVAFPALLATGLPALTANITSSVGLLTGYAGGAAGYRRELVPQLDRLRALGPPALLGGLAGAVVLLVTPGDSFRAIVPYLVLLACLLLALQPRLAAIVKVRRAGAVIGGELLGGEPVGGEPVGGGLVCGTPGERPALSTAHAVTWPARIGVFVAGVYGSYFGAGLGVLLLGVLGVLLVDDIQYTNALKTLLSFGVNAVGVAVFLISAQVSWAFAGILVVTSATGGLLGASIARTLNATVLRSVVIVLGVVVAAILIARG